MSLLMRKFGPNNIRNVVTRFSPESHILVFSRNLSIVPSVYDGDKDPAPTFFSQPVQMLLKRLTRPDFNKVFRKRTNNGYDVLPVPKYKFLTEEELEAEMTKTRKRADKLLQMPPVVKIHDPIDEVLSVDPALVGYDKSTYVFTDITFGVDNEHRIIVQRDPDGTLKSCDHDIRKRMNQAYFPVNGRKIKEPLMFTEKDRLHALLDGEKYEFILDRACVQYDPDEPTYQQITSITYQHIDSRKAYDIVRSTRHFGPMAFYLTWHQSMENLLLELLQTNFVREAVLLISLRQELLSDVANSNVAQTLVPEILATPILLNKQDSLTEEDIQLDTQCTECVEKYIISNSSMKSQQELALQGFREFYQQLIEISRGIRKAHGNAQ